MAGTICTVPAVDDIGDDGIGDGIGEVIKNIKKGLIISLSLKTLILSLSSIVYLTEKTRLSKLPQARL